MELTVVGCSGSMAGPDGPASCYLVQAPYEGRTFSLVLDLGPGAAGRLWAHLDPAEVDVIGLSHLHPDHCADVSGFYVAARYSRPDRPWPSIPLYGPPGSAARLARAYDASGPDDTSTEPGPGLAGHFRFHDWQPEQRLGPFVVTTARVRHPVAALAVRVTHPRDDGGTEVLVYSGDTGPCEALVKLARGADLLLAEASCLDRPDNPPDLHLSGRDAAEAAQRTRVGRLLLTHVPPWQDRAAVLAEARSHTDRQVALAEPGARYLVRVG